MVSFGSMGSHFGLFCKVCVTLLNSDYRVKATVFLTQSITNTIISCGAGNTEAHSRPQRPTAGHRGTQQATEAKPQRPTAGHRGPQQATEAHSRPTEAFRPPTWSKKAFWIDLDGSNPLGEACFGPVLGCRELQGLFWAAGTAKSGSGKHEIWPERGRAATIWPETL